MQDGDDGRRRQDNFAAASRQIENRFAISALTCGCRDIGATDTCMTDKPKSDGRRYELSPLTPSEWCGQLLSCKWTLSLSSRTHFPKFAAFKGISRKRKPHRTLPIVPKEEV